MCPRLQFVAQMAAERRHTKTRGSVGGVVHLPVHCDTHGAVTHGVSVLVPTSDHGHLSHLQSVYLRVRGIEFGEIPRYQPR